jgi:hypothetical protein
MEKLIVNDWHRAPNDPFERAVILRATAAPEGLDIERLRFVEAGRFGFATEGGHIASLVTGGAELEVRGQRAPLRLASGTHLYLPPGADAGLRAEAGSELVIVSAPTEAQTRGRELIVRDERFLSACASAAQSLRWILTPQYLSRRIFLHHDKTLLSKSGHPISWFHTTMFDVTGLPKNEDGESVFKMSYNSRTEINVCYEVHGEARVRMALHPYARTGQAWGPWLELSGDTSYHLNEAAKGPEEEWIEDPETGVRRPYRNKHEVRSEGHVSLFCLFDPAPTGVERHKPGEYSDYEPISEVTSRPEYATLQREISRFDEMIDRLSMARALGELDAHRGSAPWQIYEQGSSAQTAIEQALFAALQGEGTGRDRVIARWLRDRDPTLM